MTDLLQCQLALAAVVAFAAIATPAMPTSVAELCELEVESDRWVGPSSPFRWGEFSWIEVVPTGVVIDVYWHSAKFLDGSFHTLPTPIVSLQNFVGSRVIHCATGHFFAIEGEREYLEEQALVSSDHLSRNDSASLDDLRQAVLQVYPNAIELIETEQTCACAEYFDSFRPVDQTRYVDRAGLNE